VEGGGARCQPQASRVPTQVWFLQGGQTPLAGPETRTLCGALGMAYRVSAEAPAPMTAAPRAPHTDCARTGVVLSLTD